MILSLFVIAIATAAIGLGIIKNKTPHSLWPKTFPTLVWTSHQTIPTPQTISRPIVPARKKRIVVAMTGATGACLTISLLRKLRDMDIETHLIISKWAAETLKYETDMPIKELRELAFKSYNINDASAPPSSGSFQTDGMIVVPCSMKTLSAIRSGFGEELIARSADVIIKEQRKLVLCVRETPLSPIHLENMLALARIGVVIFPPVPAFYTKPESIEDIVEQSVGRMLDSLGLDSESFPRWNGMKG